MLINPNSDPTGSCFFPCLLHFFHPSASSSCLCCFRCFCDILSKATISFRFSMTSFVFFFFIFFPFFFPDFRGESYIISSIQVNSLIKLRHLFLFCFFGSGPYSQSEFFRAIPNVPMPCRGPRPPQFGSSKKSDIFFNPLLSSANFRQTPVNPYFWQPALVLNLTT